MNKLYLINGLYYVIAFDYYDAITIFENYKNDYDEKSITKIELVNDSVIVKQKEETYEEDEEDE